MRIRYQIEQMDKRTRNTFLADLIGYQIQRSLDATRKLQKLSEDKGFLKKIIDVAISSGSSTGMTVDMVLQGIKTALDIDIFSFKVNGFDVFKMIEDKLNNGVFELEVWMNPLYFSSEIALKQSVMPGFRKNVTEEYMQERMEKAGKSWMFQFEKNCKDYIDFSKCKKEILEA